MHIQQVSYDVCLRIEKEQEREKVMKIAKFLQKQRREENSANCDILTHFTQTSAKK